MEEFFYNVEQAMSQEQVRMSEYLTKTRWLDHGKEMAKIYVLQNLSKFSALARKAFIDNDFVRLNAVYDRLLLANQTQLFSLVYFNTMSKVYLDKLKYLWV